MLRFADFDARGYRTADVRTGYGEWAATYEGIVEDAMDIALLEALTTPQWHAVRVAADLGCGTGRTGRWLRDHGVTEIDGVDITSAMIAIAHSKNLYRLLVEADLAATGLKDSSYDLVSVCLVDEHLRELQPAYNEAWRLAKGGGLLVLIGFHPHFIMASGMPTHFNDSSGEPVAIETHVHLLSEHVTAALAAGWNLVELKEQVIDDRWIGLKPKWERFRHYPIAFGFAFRKLD